MDHRIDLEFAEGAFHQRLIAHIPAYHFNLFDQACLHQFRLRHPIAHEADHIGLTPQAINAIGKVRVQGKTRDQARALLADALAVQEAGAFSIVLELVPGQLAAAITERLRIPTIGIGAGAGCSGQVQVLTDLLGYDTWLPRHARRYAQLRETILDAAGRYRADVEARAFPSEAETVRMDDAVLDEVLGRTSEDRPAVATGAGIPLDRDL